MFAYSKVLRRLLDPVAGVVIITFLIGYTAGQIVMSIKIQDTPITIVPDTRLKVPVVEIYGIEDGKLVGSIMEEARVFLGGKIIVPDGSGSFATPADSLFTNYVSVLVPAGMRFVASSRGKYYYPASSSNGERITPKNRIYFPDAEAARGAGYLSGG